MDFSVCFRLFSCSASSAPNIDKVLEETQQNPFTHLISRADLWQVGKINIQNYDKTTKGTTDLISHLTTFTIGADRVRLLGEEKDPVLCQLFVKNLSGAALQWFSKLKPSTIDSFNDLSQAFMKQYSILVNPGESIADLYSLVQKKGESLRKSIDRFKSVASRVAMDDTAAIKALRRGLWYVCRFGETVSSAMPENLEDALHRASLYIKIKEKGEALHKQHASKTHSSTKDKAKDSHYKPRHHYDGHHDDKERRADATYAIDDQNLSQPWNVYVHDNEDSTSTNNNRSRANNRTRDKRDD